MSTEDLIQHLQLQHLQAQEVEAIEEAMNSDDCETMLHLIDQLVGQAQAKAERTRR